MSKVNWILKIDMQTEQKNVSIQKKFQFLYQQFFSLEIVFITATIKITTFEIKTK